MRCLAAYDSWNRQVKVAVGSLPVLKVTSRKPQACLALSVKCLPQKHTSLRLTPRHIKNWMWQLTCITPVLGRWRWGFQGLMATSLAQSVTTRSCTHVSSSEVAKVGLGHIHRTLWSHVALGWHVSHAFGHRSVEGPRTLSNGVGWDTQTQQCLL